MMTIRPGRLILWSVGALVVAAIAWSFRPQPVPVDTAAVQRGTLRVSIEEDGMTRVRERYVMSAPVAGRLRRVQLEPGDPVVAHRTVIATFVPATPSLLDPRTQAEAAARVKGAEAAQEQARVAVQRARDALAYSGAELERLRQIVKFGGATDQSLDAAELDVRTRSADVQAAELALRAAEYELEAARALLQQFRSPPSGSGAALTLRSPINGVVLRIHQESEALVAAGTPLVEVGNRDELEIVADLLSTDAVKVQAGFPVRIDGWGGDTTLHGSVRLVEPAGFTKVSALGVEEQRVNVLIDLTDRATACTLGDGYRVEVGIVIWEQNGILKVPTSALFRTADTWAVFAVRDGRAAHTQIQVGQRNALDAEVLSGLAEGDQVIVHPSDTIADGVAVTHRE